MRRQETNTGGGHCFSLSGGSTDTDEHMPHPVGESATVAQNGGAGGQEDAMR